MSAAATAAGYLYASGRLRGRAAREQEEHQPQRAEQPRNKVRVAVVESREIESREEQAPAPQRAPKTPKIEYRVRRRWSPE